METPSKQLIVFADFYILPNKILEWKAVHRPVWIAVGSEPKCLLFDVFEDPDDEGHFRLFEVWDAADQEWFEKNQLTKHYEVELWPKSKPLWKKDVVITYMSRLGEGCSYRSRYFEGYKKTD